MDTRAVLIFVEGTFKPGVLNVGAKGESVCSAPSFSQQLDYESRSGKDIIIGHWFCFYGLTGVIHREILELKKVNIKSLENYLILLYIIKSGHSIMFYGR